MKGSTSINLWILSFLQNTFFDKDSILYSEKDVACNPISFLKLDLMKPTCTRHS